MKRLLALPLALTVLSGAVVAATPADRPAVAGTTPPPAIALPRTEAAATAGLLAERLKSELQSALQAGGPLNAVTRCHDQAAPIAELLGEDSGWDVGRTSLRVRNPDNAPDAWERAVLETFELRLAAGEPAAALEHETVVTVGDQRYYRYMKAIPTGALCTACHGTTIAADLQAHIRTLYPDDRATGFKPGDLRGAFTLTRRLEP